MNESKTPLLVANFKANQTWPDLEDWIDKVSPVAEKFEGTVIISPSAPFIAAASQKLKSLNSQIKLASQDISRFEGGAYTGEYSAAQITGLVTYAIIGHSERRRNFAENDKILAQKVENAKKAKITPIFCVENSEIAISQGIEIVAYEPTFAIGTGTPDTPQNAQAVSQKLKAKGDFIILYGGSVTIANCRDYLIKNILEGLLIGSGSLDPNNFITILNSASN